MEIKNLTPHALSVIKADGTVVVLPPSGLVARVSSDYTPSAEADGITFYRVSFGEVTGLPDAADGVILVVSQMVRESRNYRDDVFSPGELVRNAEGQPIGCKGLVGNKGFVKRLQRLS